MAQALTPFQMQCLPLIEQAFAYSPRFAWMLPSWVFATIDIESGWDPNIKASDFATTGSIGLGQVTVATAEGINMQYGIDMTKGQTDPATSILTLVCVYDQAARALMSAWKNTAVPLSAIIEAYNEGPGAAALGRMVTAYWLKWAKKQQVYAFIDSLRTMVFP